jgi:hypothetical protein
LRDSLSPEYLGIPDLPYARVVMRRYKDKSSVSDFFHKVRARRPPAGLDKEIRDMEFGGEAAWDGALSQHEAIMKSFAVPDKVFCNVILC